MRSCFCGNKVRGKNLMKSQTIQNDDNNETTMEEEITAPLVDIIEKDNEFIILADIPGTEADTIDVKFNDGELSISADTIDQHPEEDELEYSCFQFDPGTYYRNFRIGDTINSDAITADYSDGVLTVHLPKREEIKPRKINVTKKQQAISQTK